MSVAQDPEFHLDEARRHLNAFLDEEGHNLSEFKRNELQRWVRDSVRMANELRELRSAGLIDRPAREVFK